MAMAMLLYIICTVQCSLYVMRACEHSLHSLTLRRCPSLLPFSNLKMVKLDDWLSSYVMVISIQGTIYKITLASFDVVSVWMITHNLVHWFRVVFFFLFSSSLWKKDDWKNIIRSSSFSLNIHESLDTQCEIRWIAMHLLQLILARWKFINSTHMWMPAYIANRYGMLIMCVTGSACTNSPQTRLDVDFDESSWIAKPTLRINVNCPISLNL